MDSPHTFLYRLKVLVLDDDVSARMALRVALAGLGITRVIDAGLSADYESLKRPMSGVEAVFSEVHFKNGNGLTLLKGIRMGRVPPLRPETPFVFVSHTASAAGLSAAMQLDADGFVVKPASMERLRTLLIRATGRICPIDPTRYRDVATAVSDRLN